MLYEIEALSSLMLERLFFSRMIAAIKYGRQPIENKKREKQVLNLVEEKCLNESYSAEIKDIFLSFFQFNIELSKFVQESYFHKWNTFSAEQMYLVYQEINTAIKNENQDNIDQLEFVRKKMTMINEKILKNLMNIQKIMSRKLYENS